MFADAVFEVVSDSTIASAVKSDRQRRRRLRRQPRREAAAERLRQSRRERQRPEREAAAVEQDDAPVDLHRLVPGEREAARPPVHRQHEQQRWRRPSRPPPPAPRRVGPRERRSRRGRRARTTPGATHRSDRHAEGEEHVALRRATTVRASRSSSCTSARCRSATAHPPGAVHEKTQRGTRTAATTTARRAPSSGRTRCARAGSARACRCRSGSAACRPASPARRSRRRRTVISIIPEREAPRPWRGRAARQVRARSTARSGTSSRSWRCC